MQQAANYSSISKNPSSNSILV